MDAVHFDTLTRTLSTASSRRRALAGLLAGALGLFNAQRADEAAAHDLLKKCKKLKDKKKKKACIKKAKKHNATHASPPPTSGGGGGGGGGSSPPGPECVVAEDCPAPPPDQSCALPTCVNSTCGVAPKGSGAPCRPATEICDVSEVCDGVALTCPTDQFRSSSVQCQPPGCWDPFTFRPAAFCTGTSATCPNPAQVSCVPYRCTGTGCASSCGNDDDCASSYYCNGTTCLRRLGKGSSCTRDRQCFSNACVSGVCCESACPAPPNMEATCSEGTCDAPTCKEGWDDCNANLSDGCETNLLMNHENCGACGNNCADVCAGHPQYECSAGVCLCGGL